MPTTRRLLMRPRFVRSRYHLILTSKGRRSHILRERSQRIMQGIGLNTISRKWIHGCRLVRILDLLTFLNRCRMIVINDLSSFRCNSSRDLLVLLAIVQLSLSHQAAPLPTKKPKQADPAMESTTTKPPATETATHSE